LTRRRVRLKFEAPIMFRLSLGLLGLCVLSPALGCSDDDAGAGGSTTATESNNPPPTYSVQETCDKFARTTCTQAAACGLVLARLATQLICVDCNESTIETIVSVCVSDLTGPQNAADVDRCLASITATSCSDACNDADVPGCEGLSQLSEAVPGPLDCDARCVSG
jgi:hypothetical protein